MALPVALHLAGEPVSELPDDSLGVRHRAPSEEIIELLVRLQLLRGLHFERGQREVMAVDVDRVDVPRMLAEMTCNSTARARDAEHGGRLIDAEKPLVNLRILEQDVVDKEMFEHIHERGVGEGLHGAHSNKRSSRMGVPLATGVWRRLLRVWPSRLHDVTIGGIALETMRRAPDRA